jgi:hypothetical protein
LVGAVILVFPSPFYSVDLKEIKERLMRRVVGGLKHLSDVEANVTKVKLVEYTFSFRLICEGTVSAAEGSGDFVFALLGPDWMMVGKRCTV